MEKIVKKFNSEMAFDNMPQCPVGNGQHKMIGISNRNSMEMVYTCQKCGFTRKLTVGKIEDSKGEKHGKK